METVMIAVVIAILIWMILILFYAIIHPFWCIVDCAISKERSGGNKTIWIVLTLLAWSFASLFYGLFSTKSVALRRTTRFTFCFSLVIMMVAVGLIVANPEARNNFATEIMKAIEATETTQ